MNIFRQIYRNEQHFEFMERRRIGYLVSGVLILIGALSLAFQGLDFSIEFRGGVVWEVPAGDATVADARAVLADEGLAEATIQRVTPGIGDGGQETLRITAGAEATEVDDAVTARLAELTGSDVNDVSLNEVGPSWGEEISRSALRALVFFFLAIALYISLRFEWKMAIAAIGAVVHDIAVTVGIYSLFNLDVSPATAIAFLTILGYSIYDTIVVFDRVVEDVGRKAVGDRHSTYAETVNTALNVVLMRSINTTITTLLPIISLIVIGSLLGAETLQDFALVLLIGLAVGAYSSIFVAAPILVGLKEREPEYAALKEKKAAGRGAGDVGGAEPVTAGAGVAGGGRSAPSGGAPAGAVSARGRKKGKRR